MSKNIMFEEIKKRFSPILLSLGLQENRNKRIWIDDCKFYVINIELQPLYSEGFFTNVFIHFLWRFQDPSIINYYPKFNRIIVPQSPIPEALLYQSPTFESDLQGVIKEMNERIQLFRTFENLDILISHLLNRKDFFYNSHRNNCNDVDIDLGIAKMLNGDRDGALRIFHNLSDQNIKELLEHCEDNTIFNQYILNTTNEVRKKYAEEYRFKLPIL